MRTTMTTDERLEMLRRQYRERESMPAKRGNVLTAAQREAIERKAIGRQAAERRAPERPTSPAKLKPKPVIPDFKLPEPIRRPPKVKAEAATDPPIATLVLDDDDKRGPTELVRTAGEQCDLGAIAMFERRRNDAAAYYRSAEALLRRADALRGLDLKHDYEFRPLAAGASIDPNRRSFQ